MWQRLNNYLFNTEFILSRNRNPWIDYVRGICIIMVIYRHCFEGMIGSKLPVSNYPILQYLNVYLFSFRMPLFFIISGIFIGAGLAKKGYKHYIDDRFRIIYYPLLIWGSIQITLQLALSHYVNADRSWMDYINLIIRPRKIEQFWYLNALFVVSVIFATLKSVVRLKKWQHLIVACVFYGVAAWLHQIKTTALFFTDVFHFYIYFAIGDAISDFVFARSFRQRILNPWLLVVMVPAFLISHYYFASINISHHLDDYVMHYMPLFFLLVSLIGCVMITQIAFYLQEFDVLRFLRVIGFHSLFIYVMHLIISSAIRITITRLLHIENVPIIILSTLLFCTAIPIVVYNVITRAGGWWMFSLKRPADANQTYQQLTVTQ